MFLMPAVMGGEALDHLKLGSGKAGGKHDRLSNDGCDRRPGEHAMILHVAPGSPAWELVAADTLLFLHIGGGATGLMSGSVALLAPKGETMHRIAGTIFFGAMLIMSGIGASVAPFLSDRPSTIAGIMTFYLVATAWMTVRRKEGTVGRFERTALAVPLAVAIAGLIFAVMAARSPTGMVDGDPPQSSYVFLIVGSIAAGADLHMVWRGGLAGAPRLARHIWRMCVALFIAAGSFFLGQQEVLPASWRGSSLLFLPELAVLGLMIFWLVRVRFARQLGSAAIAS
jgi:hypothetical protein